MHLIINCVTCENGTNQKFGHFALLTWFYSWEQLYINRLNTLWVVTFWSGKCCKTPFCISGHIWSLTQHWLKFYDWFLHNLKNQEFLPISHKLQGRMGWKLLWRWTRHRKEPLPRQRKKDWKSVSYNAKINHICDPVWQKGTYSLSIIVTDICLKFSYTILLWWRGIVCKYHCKRSFSKKVVSSQSWKSGQANLSPDQVTYRKCTIEIL